MALTVDIRSNVKDSSACASLCARNKRCFMWTYVRSGSLYNGQHLQSISKKCFLKDQGAQLCSNELVNVISGYKHCTQGMYVKCIKVRPDPLLHSVVIWESE